MDFRRKLSLLGGPGQKPAVPESVPEHVADTPAVLPDERQARIDALRNRMQDLAGGHAQKRRDRVRRAEQVDLATLPTALVQTPNGSVHLRSQRFEFAYQHGTASLAACLRLAPGELAKLALDEAIGDADPRGLLFFDTETTGLAGGAGTLPFLIGLAYFDDQGFQVEQLFLHELGNEAPMLAYLAERLARASCLVSFNGKSFDWPLVRTRFVMNRLQVPEVVRHVDLLHCLRRVYKFRLTEMRLVHLEREILSFFRHDDIPGAEIPASYFAFLRGSSGSTLAKVFEHNAHDLVALAALLGLAGERFLAMPEDDHPGERLGFAHIALRAGDHERAQAFAQAAVACDVGGKHTTRALVFLAEMNRRRGDFTQAAQALHQALLEAKPREAAAIHLTLAKLYEHKLRDYTKALTHAEQTLLKEGHAKQSARVARLVARVNIAVPEAI